MRSWRLLLVAVCICSEAWADGALRIIPLRHRFAEEVLPAVQPLVGPGGTASAIGSNLLVRTTPERLADIEQVVALLDVERRMLRITVKHSLSEREDSRHIGVAGSVRRGDVAVGVPGRDGRVAEGMTVELDQRDSNVSASGSEFISVLEGGRAVLSVGQLVPFTETWLVLTRRYAHVQDAVSFHEVTTGFAVHPRPLGDEIELEIIPRIAGLSGGVIEFQELATTVRVRPNAWFDLGGTMQKHDDVSREILTGASTAGRRDSRLWIRVEL